MSGVPKKKVRLHLREFLADTVTPLALYQRLVALTPGAGAFLLESVTGGEQVSRYSFLGTEPSTWVRVFGNRIEVQIAGGESRTIEGNPLAALREWIESYEVVPDEAQNLPPFIGGWVGYFGFDMVRLIERLPDRPPDPFGLPLAVLARFDAILAFDHARHRVLAVAAEIEDAVGTVQAQRRLDELGEWITRGGEAKARELPGLAHRRDVGSALPAASLDSAAFRAAVRTAKEHIAAGDIFQLVLARRWSIPTSAKPVELYRALRLVNPSPYMVLLELPEVALVGASPEMLVRVTAGALETRPIAGTRQRGRNAEEDAQLAVQLLADEKERAEHVMLVDLGRNDVGRVARPGSVTVAEFMNVERYSHVMHIVSSVTGQLRAERSALDALLSCFPAGTVSGAPKIRALQLIDALEPEARGPYAGAVGYLSFSGDLDTCITIRTLVVTPECVSVTAGAGIVADSDPASEERETENKAAAMLQAAALAEDLFA